MSAAPLTLGRTLVEALRLLNPGALRAMTREVPGEVLAALGESSGAFIRLLEAMDHLAQACASGDVDRTVAGLSHMSRTVVAAESAFLDACQAHGVEPDAVVDSVGALRGVLQFLTDSGSATLPA